MSLVKDKKKNESRITITLPFRYKKDKHGDNNVNLNAIKRGRCPHCGKKLEDLRSNGLYFD